MENRCSEYAAAKNLIINIIIINIIDFLIIETIIIISLNRLTVGGAAILVANIKNHHIDIDGDTIIIPLVK